MNIIRREVLVTHHEVVASTHEGTVTRRDIADLLFFADEKYEQVHGTKPDHDDAYLIEPRDDEIVAVIKERKRLS